MKDKKKIIMLSGEASLALLVKANLEDTEQFEVDVTNDILQTAEICRSKKIDALVVDTILSEQIGRQVVNALRNQEETVEVPIVLCSISNDLQKEDPEKIAKDYGANSYINKPFATNDLLKVINKTLNI